jgi:hypothetical protein
MKRIAGIVTVALAGCAANPSSDESGPVARCSVTECFNQSAIRSFEVLGEHTAVVYVGPQRCPFVVDVDGFNCGLSITPELRFFEPIYGSTRASEATGQICGSRGALYVYTGVTDPSLTQDIDALQGRPEYDTLGRRRDSFGDRLGSTRSPTSGIADVTVDTINNNEVCRVSEIHSITDDQLVELRVKEGAPPPPPIGQGKIQVPSGGDAENEPSNGAGNQPSDSTGSQSSDRTGTRPPDSAGARPSNGSRDQPPGGEVQQDRPASRAGG